MMRSIGAVVLVQLLGEISFDRTIVIASEREVQQSKRAIASKTEPNVHLHIKEKARRVKQLARIAAKRTTCA